MTTAIEKIGYDKCTGCFGCYNVCDFNAIEMKLDKLGFYYPKIYKSKCTNCNKCYNVCPIIICNKENRDINKLKVYGAHSLDENIRKISSSGGISTELGRYILRDNGVVFGVAWNKDFLVHHIEIREEKDIFKIIGSKYIQSNVLDTYEKIYKITNEEKKKVLFIGLPCQVAALKNIVNNNNLITVDLICHGVPSITVFKKYLHSKSKGDRIIYYNFRDKEKGWLHSDVKLITENGINYQCEKTKDSFFNGFICDLYLNNSCYDCKFSSIPRVGDITIGDFWKCPDSILDEKGVSIILSNNKKGDEILNSLVKRKKVKVYKSSIKECLKGNPRITNGKLKIRRERENFLKELNNSDFNYLEKKYINKLKRNVYDED